MDIFEKGTVISAPSPSPLQEKGGKRHKIGISLPDRTFLSSRLIFRIFLALSIVCRIELKKLKKYKEKSTVAERLRNSC
ncbi:hypothetical protein JTE90_017554 [Oedothorax gibbosus]|uniref:Uncharacterized protein n=1 Tax=Oedothorax gibbosus TaxID=931172 RepID=A0AAV6UPB0_9ARAC|nr:hypothetical protein JTE90_017554 [Oedothorax gibbosus]